MRNMEQPHGTIVAVAEKYDQAKKYAAAFNHVENKKTYFILSDPSILGGRRIILTWASGHLLRLKEPEEYTDKWKKWSFDNFPIVPRKFEYEVDEGNEKHFDVIAQWLQKADTIIWAGDIDREGAYITYTICSQAGVLGKDKTMKRLWVNDLLPNTVKKGFNNLQPIEDTFQQAISGKARAIADWVTGINGTRAISLLLQQYQIPVDNGTTKGKAKPKTSIGRVMTQTLHLIYTREKAHNDFHPTDYYELQGTFTHVNGTYNGKFIVPDTIVKKGPNKGKKWDGRLSSDKQWYSYLERNNILPQYFADARDKGVIENVTVETKEQLAPSLFSLQDIQKRMANLLNKTPKQTLDAVQKLYDNSYLTYPRGESNHLTMAQFKELEDNVIGYADFVEIPHNQLRIGQKPSGKFVNDKKAAKHSAIVPTRLIPTREVFNSWSNFEQLVYMEVLKRTLAIFLPLHIYEVTELITRVESLFFRTTGKVTIVPGWKALFDSKDNNDSGEDIELLEEEQLSLPKVNAGDRVTPYIDSVKRTTTRPPLYTNATLLTAMERAGFDAEDEEYKKIMKEIKGIGTPATRADTIEKLKELQQVQLVGKRFRTTPVGQLICLIVEEFGFFTQPKTTAQWEIDLRKIENRELKPSEFLSKLTSFFLGIDGREVVHQFEKQVKLIADGHSSEKVRALDDTPKYGYCPQCLTEGRGEVPIIDYPSVLKCKNSLLSPEQIKEGEIPSCPFTLFKKNFGIEWRESDIKNLLAGKNTRPRQNKKTGFIPSHKLVYDKQKGTYIPIVASKL